MGESAKAEPLDQEAVRIRQKVLGPEDPQTAESLNNLAMLYLYMGEYAKAEPLLQESVRIRQKVLGPEHRRRSPPGGGKPGRNAKRHPTISRSIPNPVSGASDSLDELTGLAIVYFTSKSLNVDVYQITLGIEMIFPNLLTELRSTEHATRSAHQTF